MTITSFSSAQKMAYGNCGVSARRMSGRISTKAFGRSAMRSMICRIAPRKARATTSDFLRHHPAASASSARAAARKTTCDLTPRRRLRDPPRTRIRWNPDRPGATGGAPRVPARAHPRLEGATDPQGSSPRSRRRVEASRELAACGSQRCLSRRHSTPFLTRLTDQRSAAPTRTRKSSKLRLTRRGLVSAAAQSWAAARKMHGDPKQGLRRSCGRVPRACNAFGATEDSTACRSREDLSARPRHSLPADPKPTMHLRRRACNELAQDTLQRVLPKSGGYGRDELRCRSTKHLARLRKTPNYPLSCTRPQQHKPSPRSPLAPAPPRDAV